MGEQPPSVDKLSTEQIERLVATLERSIKKRRLMLIGYLGALLSIVLGMLAALYVYGTHRRGTFIGWVFLIPFACAGLSLFVFGRLAKRV
jgi:hypothetical protein